MITENAIVTKANPTTAWVKTKRSSACEVCESKAGCSTAENQKEMVVSVANTLNVAEGDHVVIGLETRHMLFLTFLLYVFPIILLLIGALIGDNIASLLQMDATLSSLISGFIFFGFAFYVLRKKNNSLSKQNRYKPFLLRKKPSGIPANCTIC